MLYPTINQPIVFLIIFTTGLASALLFTLSSFLSLLLNKNVFFEQVLYFLSTIISFLIFFIANLFINYGKFRFFLLIAFVLGFVFEKIFFSKLINKILKIFNKKGGGPPNKKS